MKQLNYANQTYEAKRIVKTDDSIIGYNSNDVVFNFSGVSDFSDFTLAEGQEFDVPELSVEEKLRLEMARSNAEMFEMMMGMLGGEM